MTLYAARGKGNEEPVTAASLWRWGKAIALVIALFLILPLLFNTFESVNADEIVVIQAPVSGTLTWYTTPGVKWQGFGRVTKYRKSTQYWFTANKDQGEEKDQSIIVRFNDGGHASLSGSVRWEMPTDVDHLTSIHTKYGNQEAVERQLVRTTIEKAVYMTGPLMSSRESANERRNYLISFTEDQIANGVYQTYTEDVKVPDPITGEMKTVSIVKLKVDDKGNPTRQDESPLKTFGIRTFGLSLNNVKYDDQVESQIQTQQRSIMQVQTAIARAKQAEQDAITAQKNGEAEAAKAKWEQEVIKAKAVTEAQQKLEVAKLEADASEQYKRGILLRADADGEYKRRMMAADGGLNPKLQAYIEVNKAYAEAIQNYHGNIVPQVVSGSGGATPSNGMSFIDLLTIKAAKDLGLDMEVSGRANTRKGD